MPMYREPDLLRMTCQPFQHPTLSLILAGHTHSPHTCAYPLPPPVLASFPLASVSSACGVLEFRYLQSRSRNPQTAESGAGTDASSFPPSWSSIDRDVLICVVWEKQTSDDDGTTRVEEIVKDHGMLLVSMMGKQIALLTRDAHNPACSEKVRTFFPFSFNTANMLSQPTSGTRPLDGMLRTPVRSSCGLYDSSKYRSIFDCIGGASALSASDSVICKLDRSPRLFDSDRRFRIAELLSSIRESDRDRSRRVDCRLFSWSRFVRTSRLRDRYLGAVVEDLSRRYSCSLRRLSSYR